MPMGSPVVRLDFQVSSSNPTSLKVFSLPTVGVPLKKKDHHFQKIFLVFPSGQRFLKRRRRASLDII